MSLYLSTMHLPPCQNDGAQKFKGTLFMYMKLLSCSEIVYACFAAQTCVFTGMGYMLTETPRETKSKALIAYLWIFLYPTWHALGSVSDFIIVCMTLSRYNYNSIQNSTDNALKFYII